MPRKCYILGGSDILLNMKRFEFIFCFFPAGDENPFHLNFNYMWTPWVTPKNSSPLGVVNTEVLKCPSHQAVDVNNLDDPAEIDILSGEMLVEILDGKDVCYYGAIRLIIDPQVVEKKSTNLVEFAPYSRLHIC